MPCTECLGEAMSCLDATFVALGLQKAATESKDALEAALAGSDMVFVTVSTLCASWHACASMLCVRMIGMT